jgi:hypothetical protein
MIVSPTHPTGVFGSRQMRCRVPSELQRLLNEVLVARRQRASDRSQPGVERDFADGRQQLRLALENYTQALAASSLPVPYRIRDELRLARSCEPHRYGS